ncbi:MAG TPA: PP2C family protein-serine/threonine phosphatase [Actinospica sp.]|nr:PP2C family protein-serine/threonine phosphatase [Actinospica sp.]
MEGTDRRRLSNGRLLFGLFATTLVVSGFGAVADPQARLTSLLVFLPAFVAGQGTVRQTVFAGVWSTAAVLASVVHHPEPRIADNLLVLSGAVLFAAFAAVACRRRIAGESQIDRLRSTATALQREILRPLPQYDELVRVDGVYEPVQEDRLVGGDIYDVASTAYGTRVLIGDVQGKGVAALGAGIAVIGAFREAAHREETLAGMVAAMEAATSRHNADAAHDGEPERFVTALVLCFGVEAEVRAVDCGHPPAYLLGIGGPSRVRLTEVGVPLGLADLVDAPRRESRFAFPPEATLVLYTDGLSEARNGDGGFYPLEQRLGLFAGLTPGGLARALSQDVREYARGRQDDLAVLVVRRRREGDRQESR